MRKHYINVGNSIRLEENMKEDFILILTTLGSKSEQGNGGDIGYIENATVPIYYMGKTPSM